LRLFPVQSHGKVPLVGEWQKKATTDRETLSAWFHQCPGCNWGLATGPESRVFVVDVDGEDGATAILELSRQHDNRWIETLSVKTARGRHLYFQYPEGVAIRNSASKLARGLDVRGEGGYVIVPPSMHENGHGYEWLRDGTAIAPAPVWLVEMLTAPAQRNSPTPAVGCDIIPEGQRNVTLTSLAGAMRRPGMTPGAIEAALLAENANRCRPPLPDAEVLNIVRSVSRYEPAETTLTPATGATEAQVLGSSLDGGEILQEIVSMIRRFVGVSGAQADAIALWTLHTHGIAAADATPYLAITSAEKQSGKTRLLELLALLVSKPWLTGRVTAACLVRKIDAQGPTLLLDESDAAFNSDKEYAEALRGVLNTGHRRGGQASCCVGQGSGITFRDFQTFCPKAIAGIGKLPDTVADRSIPIRLKRKAPGEPVERFRRRTVEGGAKPVRERAAIWAGARGNALRELRPELPDALSDRQQDGCEPLLALADAAGGEWPARARAAVMEILGGAAAEDQSTGVRLLADIRDIFEVTGSDKLRSQELKNSLVEIETSPWGESNRGKPITEIGLSRLLKPYEISPRTIRLKSGTFKGYLKESLADAWSRYLPPVVLNSGYDPSHPSQVSAFARGTQVFDPQPKPHVTAQKSDGSPIDMPLVTFVSVQAGVPATHTEKVFVAGEL
jgi:hypothetical protein